MRSEATNALIDRTTKMPRITQDSRPGSGRLAGGAALPFCRRRNSRKAKSSCAAMKKQIPPRESEKNTAVPLATYDSAQSAARCFSLVLNAKPKDTVLVRVSRQLK